MIEIGEDYIGSVKIESLYNKLYKNLDRQEDYNPGRDAIRRGGNFGRRRPPTRNRGPDRSTYSQDYEDKGFDDYSMNQSSYNPPFFERASPKGIEYIPKPFENLSAPAQKNFEIKSQVEIIVIPPISAHSPLPPQKEVLKADPYNLKAIPQIENSQPILPPPLNIKPNPDLVSGQKLSIKLIIEQLTTDALSLINISKGTYEEIIAINEILAEIKQLVKKKSPSANIRLIGSIFLETYIKNTNIDIIYIDFLNPEPIDLLISSITYLDLGTIQKKDQTVTLIPSRYPVNFKFIINDELSFEISSLIKAYCKLDTRCTELIALLKLFFQNKGAYGPGFFTGLHISLLVILFLQTSEPSILPKLQSNSHQAKIIGTCDV